MLVPYIRRWIDKTQQCMENVGGKIVNTLHFTHYIAVFADNEEDLEDVLQEMAKWPFHYISDPMLKLPKDDENLIA